MKFTSKTWCIRIITCLTILSVILGFGMVQAATTPVGPSYITGSHILEIDGIKVGFLKSFKGGNVYAEVINEPVGPDKVVRKHLGAPKYEDIEIQIGANMSKPIYDWISASLTSNNQRHKGAIISVNYKMEETSRLEFYEASITETTFPACDGGSKEPSYITVKISPEWVRKFKGSNKIISTPPVPGQKLMLSPNFRLNIDGLSQACSKVNKIDSITIKQSFIQNDIGDARDQLKEPGKIEFPNITFTTAELAAEQLDRWHEEFVIKGNNGQSQEKKGTLEFLSVDRNTVLLRLELNSLGICRLSRETPIGGITRVKAEMYVEQIKLTVPPPASGSTPQFTALPPSPKPLPAPVIDGNKPILIKLPTI